MASLGQLVAGLAHEVNNPIGFVQGNIAHLRGYIEDLSRLLDAYQQQYSTPSETIQSLARDIDLEYLQEDVPKVLQSMEMGTHRITNIVRSLRNFSRLDEPDCKCD